MDIRTYSPSDKDSILDIFDSNCPRYFDPKDRQYLVDFLDNYADINFKIVYLDNHIIGCGGHYVKHSDKLFGIAWVMFKRYSLGQKSFLKVSNEFFEHILSKIELDNSQYDIVINTTQLLENYFMKFGFVTEQVIPNGFGDKLDHCKMRRKSRFSEGI